MLIMYPVGPLLLPPGEVKNNDTFYKGAGFEPVMTANQVDSMASSMEKYLEPACGKEEAILQARQVSRFAELGGGQQVQARGGGSEECRKKAWVILSIDPDRAGPSTELVTTFFTRCSTQFKPVPHSPVIIPVRQQMMINCGFMRLVQRSSDWRWRPNLGT